MPSPLPRPHPSRTNALVLTLACGAGLSGCSWFAPGESNLRVDSRHNQTQLEPRYTTSIYRFEDLNTCDIYLSDLPLQTLLDAAEGRPGPDHQGEGGAGMLGPGNLVRVHLFLTPKAGYTPIDYTASNAAVTHIVLASDQAYGVYTGGGFFLPWSSPGDSTIALRTYGANLRLAGSVGGFDDRLGACEVDGAVVAERNDEAADRLGALVSELSHAAER